MHATGCVSKACLELALKSSQAGFWISLAEFVYVPAQVAGRDLCISTRHCLQNGIVDEDVLLLYPYIVGMYIKWMDKLTVL